MLYILTYSTQYISKIGTIIFCSVKTSPTSGMTCRRSYSLRGTLGFELRQFGFRVPAFHTAPLES